MARAAVILREFDNQYGVVPKIMFQIDSEDFLYTLHLDIFFTGNASMSKIYGIHYNIGMPFSTIDNSHDACNGCCNRDDVFG